MNFQKPKRGHKFILKETGQEITLDRVQENGNFFFMLNGKWESMHPYMLDAVKKATGVKIKPAVEANSKSGINTPLNYFFSSVGLKMPSTCDNCKEVLQAWNKFGRRSCTAHILAKSMFPSIACNEDNILFMGASFLGGCSCHDSWDNKGAENRSKMPIYPLILERFEKLKPYLNDRELIQAYTYLNIKSQ